MESVYTNEFQTVWRKSESWRSLRKFPSQMNVPGSPRTRSVKLIHTARTKGYAKSTSIRKTAGEMRK